MPFVYKNVRELEGDTQVGDGDCVDLIKHWFPALRGVSTRSWRAGTRIVDASSVAPGTAIATFENGPYPNRPTSKHAALYLPPAGAGFHVVDQWRTRKGNKIGRRHIARKAMLDLNTFVDASNNALAFYTIEYP